ncbi:MAG TPA: hypothetical protein VLM80_03105 [Anaerolineales bacterium]|nr:hypothetical protein [Anaerolineales bacterium]
MPDLQRQVSSRITPTGSLKLDFALGNGGIPGGSIVEILGPDSSGTTSLCLSLMAQANRQGSACAFIDSDLSLTHSHLKAFNVDPQLTYISQISQTEQALDMIERLIQSHAFGIIFLDSINSLVPASELLLPLTINQVSKSDRLLSRALSKFEMLLRQTEKTLVITNHKQPIRGAIYHELAKNTSRLAIQFHAAIRMHLEFKSLIKENQIIKGFQIQVNLKKNRFGPCPQATKLDIMYNDGIVKFGDILDLGLYLRILTNSSNRIYYQGQLLGASYQQSLLFLKAAPHISLEIEKEIRQLLFSEEPCGRQEDR